MTESAEPRAATTAEDADRLRLDYQQTTGLLSSINDVRFKLLALVPTLSGAAVAVLGRPSSTAELLAVVSGLHAEYGEERYRPAPMLLRAVRGETPLHRDDGAAE